MPRSTPPNLLLGLALLLGLTFPGGPALADEADQIQQVRESAKKAEDRGAWLDACRHYDVVARHKGADKDAKAAARDGYQRCLRRLHLATRHADPAYRQTIAHLDLKRAYDTHTQVIGLLIKAYPDRGRADLSYLFQQGLNEVKLALDDRGFRQHYLRDVKSGPISAFRNHLETWQVRRFVHPSEVRAQVREIVGLAGRDGLPITGPFANALVMEFVAGACNALDEYSSFLTPSVLTVAQGPRARTPSVGVDQLAAHPKGVEVNRVYSGSPADKLLFEKDVIVAIGGKSVEGLAIHEVEAKLRGKAGDSVEIEFERDKMKHTVEVKFRAFTVKPVEWDLEQRAEPAIGYLRINYFVEDTAREVKDALNAMSAQASIKGLVLDLRGNPGGVYVAAIQVAELFLAEGVISVGQSLHPNFNRTFRVENPGPVQIPLVVLIDAETASAAEVLAAALQESRLVPTTIMGQTTYGKGSVQCLIELKPSHLDRMAGVRLTVARLFSPRNEPITGRGVRPTQGKELEANAHAREAAKNEAVELIKTWMMMMDMPRQPSESGGNSAAPQT